VNVTVPLTCPRCAKDVRSVSPADPMGLTQRERRLVVECPDRHVATLVVQLVDGIMSTRRSA
jgi:hypothetical protein